MLLVAPEFPPSPGGVQTYSLQLALELHRRGLLAAVATSSGSPAPPTDLPFPVHPILHHRRRLDTPALRQLLPSSPTHLLATNAAYAFLALDFPSASLCVHGNDFVGPYLLTGSPDLQRRLHLPKGNRPDLALARSLTRRLIRRSVPHLHQIFANSRFTADRFTDLFPYAADHTSVAGIGLAPHFLELAALAPPTRPAPSPNHPAQILTVARLEDPRKNIEANLLALASLLSFPRHHGAPPPFHYHIVGDGPLRPLLESRAAALDLSPHVTFHGRLGDQALDALYRRAHLFLMAPLSTPTSFEGFGIVFLEANAYGLPVLASAQGGIPDAVAHGTSGWLIPDPTPQAIADHLARFLSGELPHDPAACQAHARAHTWQSVADHIISHLPPLQTATTRGASPTPQAHPPT